MPRISICIPTYNRSDLLKKTLISVTKQTVQPFEVIVVDNCSTDDSQAVAESFKDKGVRFYKNETNIGFVGNWNRCIELANGDFLTILHSDDTIAPQWYEEWSKIISKYETDSSVGAFFSNVFTIDIDDQTIAVFKLFNKKEKFLPVVKNVKTLWSKNTCGIPASGGVIVRKSVYEKIGIYDSKYGTETDAALVLRLLNSYGIVYCNQYIYGYRIHGMQTFDKEVAFKSEEKKLKVLRNLMDIYHSFYQDGLRQELKQPWFYKRTAVMYIVIGIYHLLCTRVKTAKQYFKTTKELTPDLFSSPGDYLMLFSALMHHFCNTVIGRLRGKLFYQNFAKDWVKP